MKTAFGIALLVLSANVSLAGEVRVTGVHLCCRQCVVAVNAALADVEGVSAASVDSDNGVVTFQAGDVEAANRGLAAMAEAGFHGSPTHGDDEIAFPASGAEEEETADSAQLEHLHNCCPGCKNAIDAALENVDGVAAIAWNGETKILTVTGSDFSLEGVISALNEAGFHATVKRE